MANQWVKARQTKYAAYAATYILVVIAVIVVVNVLADRYNKSYDATANKRYSLSEQTAKIVKGLNQDATITYFNQSTRFRDGKDLLERRVTAKQRVEDPQQNGGGRRERPDEPSFSGSRRSRDSLQRSGKFDVFREPPGGRESRLEHLPLLIRKLAARIGVREVRLDGKDALGMLTAWEPVCVDPAVVFVGGPVQPGGVIGLAEVSMHPSTATDGLTVLMVAVIAGVSKNARRALFTVAYPTICPTLLIAVARARSHPANDCPGDAVIRPLVIRSFSATAIPMPPVEGGRTM